MKSFLFAPGNHPRKLEKAFGLGADAVILDLEDAVPPAEKAAARNAVIEAMNRPRTCAGYVRINGLDSEHWRQDVTELVGEAPVDGMVVPKVDSTDDIVRADELISEREDQCGLSPGTITLIALVETARGVEGVMDIAGASPRLRCLALGGGDYTLDLNYQWTEDEEVLAYARSRLTHATRVAGLEAAIDTVVLEINDDERFRDSARRGRRYGFGGKLCIHPRQVTICNEVFSPTPAELAWAREVLAAFEQAEAAGSASIQVQGQFVDYAIVKRAQRLLAGAVK